MISDGNIVLRRLRNIDSDYRLLEKWYKEEYVYKYFEQRILGYNEIRNKYYPRTLDNSDIPVYMIEYKGSSIGIIQYKNINGDKRIENIKGNIYEVDIFIGEVRYHNKGIGSSVVRLITNYLINERGADCVIMCPLENNKVAVKCYLKAGYVIRNRYVDYDTIGNKNEYLLMIYYKE